MHASYSTVNPGGGILCRRLRLNAAWVIKQRVWQQRLLQEAEALRVCVLRLVESDVLLTQLASLLPAASSLPLAHSNSNLL